jgi:transcription elongation factor GreA
MGSAGRFAQGVGMTENRAINSPAARVHAGPAAPSATQLTAADYDAVARELEALRTRHRAEAERRLRDARAFGSPADDDDLLAALEDIAVEEARIARLEAVLGSASIVDGSARFEGRAGLGCTVRVAEQAGSTAEYVLVGRRHAGSGSHDVSSASPIGMALVGAAAGDVVDVVLPNGRRRSLEILAVEPAPSESIRAA